MTLFKLTNEILTCRWDYAASRYIAAPLTEDWHDERKITIDDVNIWEVIYSQPGNIGIYSAYCPYAEFYIIIYELFLHTEYGVVSYYGPDAERDVWRKAAELGIQLPINRVWADNSKNDLDL